MRVSPLAEHREEVPVECREQLLPDRAAAHEDAALHADGRRGRRVQRARQPRDKLRVNVVVGVEDEGVLEGLGERQHGV